MDALIGAKHTQYISLDVILKMLQVALKRIDRAKVWVKVSDCIEESKTVLSESVAR